MMDNELVNVLEAILFTTESPISVSEISENLNMDADKVRKALRVLIKNYESRGGALVIKRIGRKYVMEVREDYLNFTYSFSQKELPDDVLKTLGLIAFRQSIKQSELRELLGSKVYEHVEILKSKGFIYTRRAGKTLLISTTKKFAEYFGIDSSRKEELKNQISRSMGIDLK